MSSSPIELEQQRASDNFLFVLDATSGVRFDSKREILRQSVIIPIIQKYSNSCNKITVSFATLTGSISLGLFCPIVKSFIFEPEKTTATFSTFVEGIDRFLQKELDKIVEFEDFLSGNFGIGGTVEAFCTALCHFTETSTGTGTATVTDNSKRHLILLPVSVGTEFLPNFRTCPDDHYASTTLPHLLTILRNRRISISLVAPGLSDSTVVEQFLIFKCNEKVGGGTGKLSETLRVDWIVRLSAGLTGEDNLIEKQSHQQIQTQPHQPIQTQSHQQIQTQYHQQQQNYNTNAPKKLAQIDENELLNQTLLKLSTMPPEDRVLALKTLLDPATSTFSSSFRQKFAATVKSRLQLQDQTPMRSVSQPPPPPQLQQRRASQDSSTTFWSGCIRFFEKQQSFVFRVQFVSVESQLQIPRVSLDNWPQELNLTGLLDSKKESIQAGLSVGYAFRVNVANADYPIASYLIGKMCQNSKASPSHLACFRISQDILIMLRVLNYDDSQFVGYLIDRRFPKSNLTTAAQAASNAINSLTALKTPLSTTLSTGMESISISSTRRPSFDAKALSAASASNKFPLPRQPPLKPITTNYLSYPQFIQQQQQQQHLQQHHQQQNPMISAISHQPLSSNQLLTDPQAILQKLRPVNATNTHASPGLDSVTPSLQPNEDHDQLDQSFVDAWLN